MLTDDWMSDRVEPLQDEGAMEQRWLRKKDEVEQRVPSNTMALEGACTPPVSKRKYPVALPYIKGVLEQMRRVFRSFDIPTYFKPSNTL